jgi:hypothetical protein
MRSRAYCQYSHRIDVLVPLASPGSYPMTPTAVAIVNADTREHFFKGVSVEVLHEG